MFVKVCSYMGGEVVEYEGKAVGKLKLDTDVFLASLPELKVLRGHIDWVIRVLEGQQQVERGKLNQRLDRIEREMLPPMDRALLKMERCSKIQIDWNAATNSWEIGHTPLPDIVEKPSKSLAVALCDYFLNPARM